MEVKVEVEVGVEGEVKGRKRRQQTYKEMTWADNGTCFISATPSVSKEW